MCACIAKNHCKNLNHISQSMSENMLIQKGSGVHPSGRTWAAEHLWCDAEVASELSSRGVGLADGG